MDRVTRRKLRMAQDSDDLFVVHILHPVLLHHQPTVFSSHTTPAAASSTSTANRVFVWVLVLILEIVALHCPFRVELYSDVPSDVINVLSAFWD